MASQVQAYMPLYVSDFVVSTQSLTQAQLGAYIRLLCFAWSEGGLPNDYEACSRIAGGIPKQDWAVIRKRLQVFDAGTSEERLSHPRMEKVRVKACKAYEARVAGAAKARSRKWEGSVDDQADDQVDDQAGHQVEAPELGDSLQLKPKLKLKPKPNPLKGSNESPNGDSRRSSSSTRPPPVYHITWNLETGFSGITAEDRERWRSAFPAVDAEGLLPRIHEYLVSHPSKQKKRNWPKFLYDWFSRTQEGAQFRPAAARRNCL